MGTACYVWIGLKFSMKGLNENKRDCTYEVKYGGKKVLEYFGNQHLGRTIRRLK